MKSITKITLCSCFFCYFAGLWTIASRFGLVKLITKYGLSESFDQIPKDFPQIKYLYIGLAIYTIVFIILSYFIVRYCELTEKKQEQLQQEASVVASYSEEMSILLSQFECSEIKDAKTKQKLQSLSRKIASLPPMVARNTSFKTEVVTVINNLQDMLLDNSSVEAFSTAIDKAQKTIDSIKRRSVTVKY